MATDFQTRERRGGMGDPYRHLPSPTVYASIMLYPALLLFPVLLLFPTPGSAQSLKPRESKSSRPAEKDAPVPKAYLPPRGMCRVWVDNVPAARQPAPTDCATAIRNRPPNARVIFPAARDGRAGEPKSLAPNRPRVDTTKRKPPA